jgi:hypothetical protein
LSAPPPSITRLFARQKGFPWVGEARAIAATEKVMPPVTDLFTDGITNIASTSPEIDLDERADAVLKAAPAHATEREILRVDIERVAHKLVKTDPAGSRILHSIIVADDHLALAALGAALARGLSSTSS